MTNQRAGKSSQKMKKKSRGNSIFFLFLCPTRHGKTTGLASGNCLSQGECPRILNGLKPFLDSSTDRCVVWSSSPPGAFPRKDCSVAEAWQLKHPRRVFPHIRNLYRTWSMSGVCWDPRGLSRLQRRFYIPISTMQKNPS